MFKQLLYQLFGRPHTSPAPPASAPARQQPAAAPPRGPASIATSPARTVFDANASARALGKILARGGEGTVYHLADNPDVLVKLYHSPVLLKRPELGRKIEAMRRDSASQADPNLAWPRISVYDDSRQWVGYAMRKLRGTPFQTLCQYRLIQERLPAWSRRELAATALSFVEVVSRLHDRGIIIGDINPGNFVVDPQTSRVSCLDCDSFQVRASRESFLCRVGIPDFQAPEIMDCHDSVIRTVEHERFGVAVMLFKLLMLGQHPYNHMNGTDPVSNMRQQHCPLGHDSDCRLPAGPWYRLWSHLPFRMKELFVQAFRDGNAQPERRPDLATWSEALRRYLREMDKGWHSTVLLPADVKTRRARPLAPCTAGVRAMAEPRGVAG